MLIPIDLARRKKYVIHLENIVQSPHIVGLKKQLVTKSEASPKAVLDYVGTSEDRVGVIKVSSVELSKSKQHLSLLSKD